MTLDTTSIILMISSFAGILLIILIILVIRLQLKIKRLLGGSTSTKSIEDGINHISANMKDLEKFRADLEKYLTTVENRLKKSVQSVHTIRFNPFKGTGSGGNQSFATAFLNQEGDGVVLSSLYSREHVSIFSKPVKNGKPEFELSEEENQALKAAQKEIPVKTEK